MYEHLWRIARAQDGLLANDDFDFVGLTAWQRRRLVQRGDLERVAPRVYSVAGAPWTWRSVLRVGLLCLGPRSWVSYEAAAALHGLDRSDRSTVEFTVPRHRRPGAPAFVVHTTKFMPPIDQVVVDDLRATSATRTILDLALARKNLHRVEAAIDSAVRLGLTTPEIVATRLENLRGSGRWGCRLIDRLLVDSGGHSPLERDFLRLVREAALPRPRAQVVHRKNGRHVARVDFLFDEVGVVVEVTGGRGHSTPLDRTRDAQRRNELQDLGRLVFEHTSKEIRDHPERVKRQLRERLRSAGLRC